MANEFKIRKGLIVEGASGGTVVDVQGSQGQLFSVTDDLSGSIFAVSDISGVPILDVNSSGLSTFDGNVTIGSISTNVNRSLTILADDSNEASINLYGNSQGTGLVYVGQSSSYGGGIVYNGDGSPAYGNSTTDTISFYRREAGTNSEVFRYGYGGAAVTFVGEITTTELNLPSGGMVDWANGDARIIEGQVGGYSLSFEIYNGTAVQRTLLLEKNMDATFTGKAFSSATSSGNGSSTLTTKGYVDGLITGATIYRGAWDPSGGGYGSPDLSGVTQTSGYYYICSAAGTAEPNGTGTEPDSWEVGDWVIYNDVSGTGQWQKIDNSSVLSGVGTGQTVALWEGAASVTDSETLGNAPITVSGNNTTFAGNVLAEGSLITRSVNADLTISGDTNGNIYYNSALGEHRWRASGSSVNSMNLSSSLLTVNENATFTGNVNLHNVSSPTLSIKDTTADVNLLLYSQDSNSHIGTYSNHSLIFDTNSTTALSLDASQNATFVGDVGLGGTGLYTASHSLNIDGTGLAIKNDANGSNNNWSSIKNTATASTSNFVFTTGAGISLTLNHNKSATFSSNVNIDNDLTVSGGDITLGGTGRIQGIDTVSASTDAANKAYVDSSAGNPSHFRQGFKTQSVGTAFSDVLTVGLAAHTGCYVTLCCFGDWGSHSTAAYRGEFFLQNGGSGYNEPGIIIRQDDNTSDGTDQIICQIVDPAGSAGVRNFVIQIRHTDTTSPASFSGTLTFTVQGQFNSVT